MKIKQKYIFIILIILAVSFLAYCFYPVIFFQEKNSPKAIILYDRNGIKITDKPNKFGYKLELTKNEFEKIKDSNFIKSLIKIEDKNFYNHFGVDFLAKLRALKDNLSGKRISGASTITEQFIKNKYFLGEKRTYLQKAREAILAIYFSLKYDKNDILRNYLNNIFVGNNLYGIKTASKVYFHKNIEELNNREIVILLSLLNYPSTKSLKEESFLDYENKIIERLSPPSPPLKGGINPLIPFSGGMDLSIELNKLKSLDKFPFVTENYPILEFLPLSLREGGTKISIDSKFQEFTKEVIKNTLEELKGKNVTNAAVFALYKPPLAPPSQGGEKDSWQILIYQGSKDFYATDIDGQVDVIKALRQPGSTMKPFLYLYALEQGYGSENLLVDLENEYNSFKNSKKYISENYSLKEYGLVRFKKALGNSLNNASVRLVKELGFENVYNFYKKYSFKLNNSPDYYGYSLVLGNPSIKLYDLVNSYKKLVPDTPLAPLGEGGTKPSNPFFRGNDKERFLLYDILSDPDNRDISFGVNSILNTSVPMAVKTGTSSDFRDNLVISYHPDLVIGVWVGNNDNSSMKGVTGITGAGYIWHQIAEKAIELGYVKDRKIKVPEGIITSDYCLDRDCYRKEIIYKEKNKKYYSRIYDNYYSKKDILENLSSYELEKLRNLGFEIRE